MKNSAATQLIVALDYPTAAAALKVVEDLKSLPLIFKVGSELFCAAGPDLVRRLTGEGHSVFLDLKFHDIPNTVAKAVASCSRMGVSLLTVHLVGGGQMMAQIQSDMQSATSLGLRKPKILGVSVLTSFDDSSWSELSQTLTGKAVKVDYSVTGLVEKAVKWGLDGVVCSAWEVQKIRATHAKLFTVVPGIRLAGSDKQDQGRVVTPQQASQWGAHAIVVGRPITQAASPRAVAESILQDLSVC